MAHKIHLILTQIAAFASIATYLHLQEIFGWLLSRDNLTIQRCP
jgi:hypothetical protein